MKDMLMDRPDFKIGAYEEMQKDWMLTRDMYAGARIFKDGEYLKQFERETDEAFSNRKEEADLYAVFQSAINTDVGMVFQTSITPTDVPEALSDLFRDIDLCGNDLDMFLRDVFRKADRDGHSFIFVDAPRPVEGDRVSLADVQGRRPWWICYEAAQALNWRTRDDNGKIILEQITLEETLAKPKGEYGEEIKTQYRVLRNENGVVSYSVYELDEKKNKIVVDGQENVIIAGFDEIPLYVMYGKKKSPYVSTPPRLALAETNKKHFNKLSLLDYALSFIKPFIVFKLDDKNDADNLKLDKVAVNNAVKIYGENAQVYYLELKGESIPEFRKEITGIEERMAKLSFERFAPVRDNSLRTATEVGSDNRREMSELAVMAKNLENCVESAFDATIQYLRAIRSDSAVQITDEERSGLSLNIEYDKLTFTNEQMQLVMALEEKGLLSAETLLELLPRFIDMPKGWDKDEELAKLSAAPRGFQERVLDEQRVIELQGILDNNDVA